MIGAVEKAAPGIDREAYASAVGHVWEGVGSAVARLERIASTPAEWSDLLLAEELPRLQYRLHAGAELVHGIRPPAAAAAAHDELVGALAHARDATSEAALALDTGGSEGLEPYVPEWRGALFRVRLARLRALAATPLQLAGDGVATPPLVRARQEPPRPPLAALAASVLVVGGGLLFTAGAVLAAWPLWAAGLMLVGGGLILHHP
jgi:hypothetical protein